MSTLHLVLLQAAPLFSASVRHNAICPGAAQWLNMHFKSKILLYFKFRETLFYFYLVNVVNVPS
jgi:hypothetical protein